MRLFSKIFKTKDSNRKLPEGWKETKISENTYLTHIPQEQKDKWGNERRKKDNIDKLSKKDGFHDKPNGRAGTIYYVEKGKVCELDYEISGVKEFDILIYFDQLTEWILPEIETLSLIDKQRIKLELQNWLDSKKIRAEL